MIGLIRVGCSPLAIGRLRPSQWHKWVCTAPWWVASTPVALRRLRQVGGRLNSAFSLVGGGGAVAYVESWGNRMPADGPG
jgi:hypothetical protein